MASNQPGDFRHLSSLDGFRALLALWVYVGHLAYAVGYDNRLLSMHPLAVDLFMVLSGFLMVHTWKSAQGQQMPYLRAAGAFYVVRIFRIAPLYYVLLIVCSFFLTELAAMHDAILAKFPPPWSTGVAPAQGHTAWYFGSFEWLWLHVTLMFGAVPGMEASTPLPDWSLSLEMQYYLVFPLLLVLFRRLPMIVLVVPAAVMAWLAPGLFGNYLDPGTIAHFGQPSLLAYRLNAFMAGMVVAFWLRELNAGSITRPWRRVYLGVAAAICVAPLTKLVILAYGVFVLLAAGNIPWLNRLFSLRPLRFLGDISYSIYLCHLLIVAPVVYFLIVSTPLQAMQPLHRFVLSLLITAPLVIVVSLYLYRAVELPTIRAGRMLSKKILSA